MQNARISTSCFVDASAGSVTTTLPGGIGTKESLTAVPGIVSVTGWKGWATVALLAAVFATMGPTVIGMSLNQIATLVDQTMAYGILGEGANTYLYLANRLLLFPHALTALAVTVDVRLTRFGREA